MNILKHLFCKSENNLIDEIEMKSENAHESVVEPATLNNDNDIDIAVSVSNEPVTIKIKTMDDIINDTKIDYTNITTVTIVDGNTNDVSVIKSPSIPRIMMLDNKLDKIKALYALMGSEFPFQ